LHLSRYSLSIRHSILFLITWGSGLNLFERILLASVIKSIWVILLLDFITFTIVASIICFLSSSTLSYKSLASASFLILLCMTGTFILYILLLYEKLTLNWSSILNSLPIGDLCKILNWHNGIKWLFKSVSEICIVLSKSRYVTDYFSLNSIIMHIWYVETLISYFLVP